MASVKQVIPILPVPLMSEIMLTHGKQWRSELELKVKAVERIKQLREQGAPITISDAACERVLSGAMDMLIGRGFVEEENNLYRVNSEAVGLLRYYANSINHWKLSP